MRPGSGGGRAVSRQAFVYDPTTAAFQREMHAVYRTLRDDHPVYAAPDGTYVLSRFEDVWNAVNDWASFSSAGVAEAAQLQPQMIYMDPPNHTSCGGWSRGPSPRSGWPISSPGCARWPTSCWPRWRRPEGATWCTSSPAPSPAPS